MSQQSFQFAPFYPQQQQVIIPNQIPLQKPNQVLEQLQAPPRMNQNVPLQNPIVHQQHTVTHPQVRDIVHREAPITVVSREQIESVWRQKCTHLEQALTEVQTEVMRLRGIGMSEKVTYVEDTLKINQLYLEIDRLNKCLLDMSLELENYKHKYHMVTDKQARNIAEIEIDKLRNIMLENESLMNQEINRLRQQLDEWQKRYRILELSLSEARGGEGNVRDMEQTIAQLRQDVDRGIYNLNAQRAETEDWKLRYQRLESQHRDIGQQDVELRRLREMVDSRNREIEALRVNQVYEVDQKQQQQKQEIERLQSEIRVKNAEIDRQKSQIQQLEYKLADTSRLSTMDYQYKQLQRDHDDLLAKYNELRAQNRGGASGGDDEARKLKEQVRTLQDENEDWRQRYNELLEKCDELELELDQAGNQDLVTKYKSESESWQLKCKELNNQYFQLQSKQRELEAELDVLRRGQKGGRNY
ncbi:hypothetical protein pb186bvf_016519 [Paramecium bursaria]